MSLISSPTRVAVLSVLVVAGIALAIRPGEAHKAITSKYTYNDDVFPILRDRCASCHVTGGEHDLDVRWQQPGSLRRRCGPTRPLT